MAKEPGYIVVGKICKALGFNSNDVYEISFHWSTKGAGALEVQLGIYIEDDQGLRFAKVLEDYEVTPKVIYANP